MTYDAVVVGAGPAGSTAAILLAKAGWSVAIVERSPFPRRKVCGEFVSATNMPILDELGIGAEFRNAAGPEIRRVGLFARNTITDAPMPEIASHVDGWGRALGRERLDLLLLEQAARLGVRVWQPYRVVQVEGPLGARRCRIVASRDERVLHGGVVIAAHGSAGFGSLPRPTRGPSRSSDSDLIAFKANFAGCDLPSDLMPLLAFPGGYGGMVTQDSDQVCLSCCIRRDALTRCRANGPGRRAGDAVLQHIQRTASGAREVLRGSERLGVWLASGPIRPGIRRWHPHDDFPVGNAAGEAHPIIAEGISLAIQSSYSLTRLLVTHQDRLGDWEQIRQLGSGYRRQWKGSFASRIHASALFAQLAVRGEAAFLLAPVLHRYPKILTLGAAISGKGKMGKSFLSRPASG